MSLKPLGDSACLIEFHTDSASLALSGVHGLMHALEKARPHGVLDLVPSFDSLAAHFGSAEPEEVFKWMNCTMFNGRVPDGEEKVIPVCYDGPDLQEVAEEAGLTVEEVVKLHSGADYTVAAVGFSPGFPYLLGLPERLHLPRRATPRARVEAGSVAIGGGQAGIYPSASPGGWHVLGRTGESLFDPHAPVPALLKPGDRVRFVPVDAVGKMGKVAAVRRQVGRAGIEVIHAGGFTTVQDFGRPGYEPSGVSPGGAADVESMRLANLMVGNDEDAAGLEICVSGPVLKFRMDTVVALVSGTGRTRKVAAGETVDFSRLEHGVRAFLAVAGGIKVPEVLGSLSTDVRAGFGGYEGRALKAGDLLAVGERGEVPSLGDRWVGRPDRRMTIELRFLQGVQYGWFSTEAWRRFQSETYELTPRSDRMGARLKGAPLELREPREMRSQPVVCGSVQVPPDGQPIVLLAERQTIGGYPQIGHVISVDLPKLARAWPGTAVRFREVTLAEARELRRRQEQDFKWLRTGLKLLK